MKSMGFAMGLALSAATAASALAQHDGDMILRVQGAGPLEVGTSAGGTLSFPARLFIDRFGKLGPSLPNRTPDPGLNALPNQFPLDTEVGIRIRRAARVWNEGGGENFCAIPDERIEIRKGSRVIITPTSDLAQPESGPAIVFGFSDPFDGLFHEHGAYWLTTPFDSGVYLLEAQIEAEPVSGPTLVSGPIWLVFAQNAVQSDLDAAAAFVLDTLVAGSGNLCRCRADWNDDGSDNADDIFAFLSDWFTQLGAPPPPGTPGSADFNASGTIDADDIFAFLNRWFAGC